MKKLELNLHSITTIKQFSGIFSILAIVGATICYCMGHADNAILFLIWSLILRD